MRRDRSSNPKSTRKGWSEEQTDSAVAGNMLLNSRSFKFNDSMYEVDILRIKLLEHLVRPRWLKEVVPCLASC